jgi:very-short-patch-repair endonuclease
VSEINLLKDKFPELLKEWSSKNATTIIPEKLTYGSNVKIWWICNKGHEWEASVKNRTKGRKCPYCVGKKASKYNNLEFLYPDIAKEWHPIKNLGITPLEVTTRTLKKVWWRCKKGHEWEAAISNRTKGGKCPVCNIDNIVNNERRWFKNSSVLISEWHKVKNGNLKPEDVALSYNKLIWWKCEKCSFEWQAKLNSRYNGHRNCIQCELKNKSLRINNPKLAKEWHPTKNGKDTPDNVFAYTNKKYWWICSICNEEWRAQVSNRQMNSNGEKGCPFCAGKRVGKKNSLQTKYPQLLEEWHPTKNKELSPDKVYYSTLKKVWWKCKKGHEWEESVRVRVVGSKNLQILGCPFCSGHRVSRDNCLSVVNPQLAKEWHPIKNELTANDVTKGSHKLVWWQCLKGHEWKASVSKRSSGRGCPFCKPQTSFPEQVVFYYFNKMFPSVKNRFSSQSKTDGYEIDVFIEDLNIGIEYDGYFYHKEKRESDEKKSISLASKGILLLRIREEGLFPLNNGRDYVYSCNPKNEKSLEEAIKKIISFIGVNYLPLEENSLDIDIKRDKEQILNSYYFIKEQESIYYTNPEVIKFWNWDRNTLSPKNLRYGSAIKVWWVCSQGHEWEASINKIVQGRKCPYCSNKKVYHPNSDTENIIGNSLASRYPEIAKQWHPIKNDDLKPEDVVYGSHKSVWWLCSFGHEWKSPIARLTKRGQECGICSGRGKRILTINEVKKIFEKENCTLLEDKYVNSTSKMKYVCSCGNESYITLSKFKQGQRCRGCFKKRIRRKDNRI